MKSVISWVKRHKIWSAIIGLVVLYILFKILVPTPPDYEYETAKVDSGEVVRTVSASGKLRALNTINVGSEISGQVTRVYVDFNSPVTAGQVLAEIDSTRPRARVQQAQAQVALAQASLNQANAAITRARTDVEVQQRQFARSEELVKQGFVSKAAMDQAQNALASARASMSTALAQAQSARAQISQSSAELNSARLDLSRTRIVAPTSGVIINKLVDEGTTVAASFQTPNLFEIAADTSRMQVEASVDEADIGQIRDGQAVEFTVDSYPDETFEAVVQQIRKSATEAQNVVSYLVILDVDNKDGKLLTGMTANVEIVTGKRNKVTRVPVAALRFRPRKDDRPDDGETTKIPARKTPEAQSRKAELWVVGADPYKPQKKTVTIGLEGEEYVEIVKGVKAGDEILVRSRSLADGQDGDEDEDAGDPGAT